MNRRALPDLALAEWAVLAAVAEQASHGFAIAKEFAPDGDLGQIWTVRRPVVYRALAELGQQRLIEPVGEEPGARGPVRTRVRPTRIGRDAVDLWLSTPVGHVREMRSQLLLKLRLLDRRGADLTPLATAQLELLGPIMAALHDQASSATGFSSLLTEWRYESTLAAARVLEGIVKEGPPRRQAELRAPAP